MSNEFRWHVTVDGVDHLVECAVRTNKYEVWVDEGKRTTVYRKAREKSFEPLEAPIQVGTKTCRLVAMNGVPDLEVDGILQNSGTDYGAFNRQLQVSGVVSSWIRIGVGIIALIAGVVMASNQADLVNWLVILLFGVYFGARGLWELTQGNEK